MGILLLKQNVLLNGDFVYFDVHVLSTHKSDYQQYRGKSSHFDHVILNEANKLTNKMIVEGGRVRLSTVKVHDHFYTL